MSVFESNHKFSKCQEHGDFIVCSETWKIHQLQRQIIIFETASHFQTKEDHSLKVGIRRNIKCNDIKLHFPGNIL